MDLLVFGLITSTDRTVRLISYDEAMIDYKHGTRPMVNVDAVSPHSTIILQTLENLHSGTR